MTDAEKKAGQADEEPGWSLPREDAMFGLVKELFAFGYGAAEKMEERAAEFAKMRHERMEDFRKEREEMGSKFKGTFEERTGEVRGRVRKEVQSVMRETGVATQGEIDELKTMIADLSKKLDAMSPGEKHEKGK